MSSWNGRPNGNRNRNFQSQLHLSDHPVPNRIYAARGILKVEDLDLSLSTLLSPDEMPNVELQRIDWFQLFSKRRKY